MLHATLDLARRVERAEIDFCALGSGVGAPGGAASIEVAGGRAVCADVGMPMNKVLGLGLGVPVADEDLDALEEFYGERGSPVQIELCPLAMPGLAARLTERGYVLQAFENEMARLAPFDGHGRADVRITRSSSVEDDEVWGRVVSVGFAAGEAAAEPTPETVATLGGFIAGFAHPDITRYVAWVDGEPCGGGAAFVHDGVLGIFGTATLPRARRRGIQSALVARSLDDAGGRADLAIASVEPGSRSQRTFERFGFHVIYTRAILIRP